MNRLMKVVLALALVVTFTGCSYVDQGEVGVVVNKFGSDKGIVAEEVTQGYFWYGFRKRLVKFPTYKQNYVWTLTAAEGSNNDEAIYFSTKDGMAVNCDMGITYAIIPNMADTIFSEYRLGVEEITDRYIRNMVRDEANSLSSKYSCEDVYGEKKAEFFGAIESNVIARCASKGMEVESIYLIGRPRLPPIVETAINAKIAATQQAQMRENEIAEAEAAALKIEAKADGDANAFLATEGARLKIMAQEAELLKANPELLQMEAIKVWDGILPKFTSGSAPLPFIDVSNSTDAK